MNKNTAIWGTLAGIGAGAAVMYFMDPDRGRRRRALIRDKAVSAGNAFTETVNARSKDLANRSYGVAMEAKKMVGFSGSEGNDEGATTQQSSRSVSEESNRDRGM
jgi:gas vesicle protein